MRKVFVTGATGKTGTWFQKKLIEEASGLTDYSFCFAVRNNPERLIVNESNLNFEAKICDIYCKYDLDRAFEVGQCDTLLHIAGIQASAQVVKSAIEHGVKRLILVHTTGVYSKYKAAGEEYRQIEAKIRAMIQGKDINLTILRPTMIYGSMQDQNVSVFVKMVDRLRFFPIVNDGRYELQPVHAKDLGTAYYQVLVNEEITKNKDYILSGGNEILLIDIFKYIEENLGRKNIYIRVPFCIAYAGAWGVFCLTIGRKDYREKVQRLVEPRAFSHEEAVTDFGFNPRNFEVGVLDEIEEYITLRQGEFGE